MPYCEQHVIASDLNAPSNEFMKPLYELATDFVHSELNICQNHPQLKSSSFLLQQAIEYIPKESAKERISKVCETLNPEIVSNINQIVNQLVEERMSELEDKSRPTKLSVCASNNNNKTDVVTEVQVDTSVGITSVDNVLAKKSTAMSPKTRGGSNDLPRRKELPKTKCDLKKNQICQEIWIERPSETSELTEGARTFIVRSLTPVMNCLSNHYNNDVNNFIARWTKIKLSKF